MVTEDATAEQQRHAAWTEGFYGRFPRIDRGAVRSGHSDAAHMCDAIARDIEREHTVRGKVTKRGQELAAAVKAAADAIWAMREKL